MALAAPGLAADDLVLLGKSGARADTVADLHTRGRVWAARAEGDWMRWVPAVRTGDLGHGTDPVSPGFGARLLPSGGHDRPRRLRPAGHGRAGGDRRSHWVAGRTRGGDGVIGRPL